MFFKLILSFCLHNYWYRLIRITILMMWFLCLLSTVLLYVEVNICYFFKTSSYLSICSKTIIFICSYIKRFIITIILFQLNKLIFITSFSITIILNIYPSKVDLVTIQWIIIVPWFQCVVFTFDWTNIYRFVFIVDQLPQSYMCLFFRLVL